VNEYLNLNARTYAAKVQLHARPVVNEVRGTWILSAQ